MAFPGGGISSRTRLGIQLLLCAFICGCGSGSGLDRIAIKGNVKAGGKNADSGRLTFLPNDSGPTAMTTVVGGHYSFTSRDGPVAGSYTVAFEAFASSAGTAPGGKESQSTPGEVESFVSHNIVVTADGPTEIDLDLEPGDPNEIESE